MNEYNRGDYIIYENSVYRVTNPNPVSNTQIPNDTHVEFCKPFYYWDHKYRTYETSYTIIALKTDTINLGPVFNSDLVRILYSDEGVFN